jgi:hypothetical protein
VISIIVNLFSVGAETNPEAPITTKSKLVAASAEPAVERAVSTRSATEKLLKRAASIGDRDFNGAFQFRRSVAE